MKPSFPWQRILWIIFVLALPAIIIYKFFPKVFSCPACFLYGNTGDGLKNYYTLDYYVLHDKGWHFTGMNYPYGENIIYTDNQPLLAMVLQWVHQHIVPMDRHVVGTLNILLLLSLYLSVLILYKLMRRWEIGRWWSLGTAVCITFLSPQLWRIQGHYGLAYVFFLPLLLLLLDYLVRGQRRKGWWSLSIGILIVAMSLTHMYFLILSTVVLAAYTVCWWWYHRKEKPLVRSILPWLMAAIILPGLFLVGLRKWTDPVTDRPIEPWGIDEHTISFETTFFPFTPPMDKTWSTILHLERPITERQAYVGLAGLLFLPAVLFFFFSKRDEEPVSLHIKAIMGAAIVTWFMGAGIVYHHGFKFIWEAVPLLKQFRGLGRFGIPFYYLYLLVCSYLIWRLYRRMKERALGGAGTYLLGAIILYWGFESYLNLNAVREPIFNGNEWLASSKNDYVPLLTAAGYKPESFQAILQLPLVAIGNETVGVARGFWTMREGIHASKETGLPMIDYAMSRTSVSQGLDIVELISTPYAPKRRAQLFNDLPLLLVCEEEFMIPAERKWIDKATKIGTYKSITLYSLPAAAFKTETPPALPPTDKISDGWFVGFEDHPCDTTMTGLGAMPVTKAPLSIWSYVDTVKTERQWIVSLWTHVDNLKGAVAVPRMMEIDSNGTVTLNTGLHREHILWSEALGEWIEISFPWVTRGNGFKYELFIDNTGPVIDNLLIRPASDTCVYHFPGTVLYNNLPIPQSK